MNGAASRRHKLEMMMGTKNKPAPYDCYANAHPDEPMFTLLGRDKFGASLVRLWALARETDDESQAKLQEARDCADAMAEWCNAVGKNSERALAYLPFDVLAEELRQRGATVQCVPHGGDGHDAAGHAAAYPAS
jgi:hypothetical protein